jgi:co-chaperonin GroES (HSP10)
MLHYRAENSLIVPKGFDAVARMVSRDCSVFHYFVLSLHDFYNYSAVMQLSIDNKELDKFLMIGDRVLVKPTNPQGKTKSGLLLPPTVQEGEKLQTGYVIKTGPGLPLPSHTDDDELWKKKEVSYLPLQAKPGDMAVYLQSAGLEVSINEEKYLILPHSSILMLVRDKELFQ